jgi:hypothetical protein
LTPSDITRERGHLHYDQFGSCAIWAPTHSSRPHFIGTTSTSAPFGRGHVMCRWVGDLICSSLTLFDKRISPPFHHNSS